MILGSKQKTQAKVPENLLLLLLLSQFSCVQLCATHRWQSTRLPRPWDSPGKNTGVGCHFLLQCMKVKSQSEVAQLCPTLSDPMDCSPSGSSILGIFQARVLERGAIAFARKPGRCIIIKGILVQHPLKNQGEEGVPVRSIDTHMHTHEFTQLHISINMPGKYLLIIL